MPTSYNIKFMTVHPLGMTFNPPENAAVLKVVEEALREHGMVPIAASSERGDDPTLFTEREGKAWIHNAPDDLILAVAKMLDGFVAQLVDPDADLSVVNLNLGPWDEPSAVATAEAFLEYRKKATS